jgi:hypothetical protein
MFNVSSIAVVVALGLAIGVNGLAADNPSHDESAETGQRTFEALDKNKDGKISAAEARKDETLSKLFSGLDGDKDGAISRAEFAAYDPAGAAQNL